MNRIIFIASPLVGAGIGYVTNLIAIKMLFRPLKPLKIFGKEISAFQGVIPKRHKELAESVGNTVGEHLLTEDAFENILSSDETKLRIRQLIRESVEKLQTEERTIDEILKLAIPQSEEREILYEQVNEFISSMILETIRSEKTIENVEEYLNDFFQKLIYDEKDQFIQSAYYKKIKGVLREYLLTTLRNPIVFQRVSEFLHTRIEKLQDSDERIEDILPSDLVNGIRSLLVGLAPKLSNQLIGYLKSEEIREKITDKVGQFFDQQGFLMGMLGKLFGDKTVIADKIASKITEFVNDTENQDKMVEKITEMLDNMLNTRVANLANKVDNRMILSISEFLVSKAASQEFIDNILESIEDLFLSKAEVEKAFHQVALVNEIPSIEGIVESSPKQLPASELLIDTLRDGKTKQLIRQLISDFLHADLVETGIHQLISNQLIALRERKIQSFFMDLKLATIEKAEDGILTLLEFASRNYLGKIIDILNFDKLVEEKILSFDLEEMEALVLQVMSVELRAITWFGFYLGLLMGLITPFINMLIG